MRRRRNARQSAPHVAGAVAWDASGRSDSDGAPSWSAVRSTAGEELFQECRSFGGAHAFINFGCVVAGWLRVEASAVDDAAALDVAGCEIEPVEPGERDRAGAHGAGFQRDV